MSRFLLASSLALSALALIGPGATAAQASEPCYDVRIQNVRGTWEPQGPSLFGLDGPGGASDSNSVSKRIINELANPSDGSVPITSVKRTDLAYQADAPVPDFNGDLTAFENSAAAGSVNLAIWLNEIHAACPNTRFVLLGYSQGAIVIGNTLVENEVSNPLTAPPSTVKRIFWPYDEWDPQELNTGVKEQIAAIGLFSDAGLRQTTSSAPFPAITLTGAPPGTAISNRTVRGTTLIPSGGNPFLAGTYEDLTRGNLDASPGFSYNVNGFRPRPAGVLDEGYFGKWRSYCLINDPICHGGATDWPKHLTYGADVPSHRNLAIFAVEQLRNRVNKSVAATCTVNTGTYTGTTFPGTINIRAKVQDRVASGGTITVSGINGNVTLANPAATTLWNVLGQPTTITPMSSVTLRQNGTDKSAGGWPASPTYNPTGPLTLPLVVSDKTVTWTAPALASGATQAQSSELTLKQARFLLFPDGGTSTSVTCEGDSTEFNKLGRFVIASAG